jgi:hypothetical protein
MKVTDQLFEKELLTLQKTTSNSTQLATQKITKNQQKELLDVIDKKQHTMTHLP